MLADLLCYSGHVGEYSDGVGPGWRLRLAARLLAVWTGHPSHRRRSSKRIQCYSDPGAIRQQFTSKERDQESGLDFFGADISRRRKEGSPAPIGRKNRKPFPTLI
jgi:hypothetical protein